MSIYYLHNDQLPVINNIKTKTGNNLHGGADKHAPGCTKLGS